MRNVITTTITTTMHIQTMVMMIKQRGEGTLKVMLMQYCDDSDVYTYLHTYVRHTIDKTTVV